MYCLFTCYALSNVLQGSVKSWDTCGCYIDMCLLPKHCCRPCVVLLVGSGIFQQDNVSHRKHWSGTWQRVQVALTSNLPRAQSNQSSVGCAGKNSFICGGSILQFTGFKGYEVNIYIDLTEWFTFSGLVEACLDGCELFGYELFGCELFGCWKRVISGVSLLWLVSILFNSVSH